MDGVPGSPTMVARVIRVDRGVEMSLEWVSEVRVGICRFPFLRVHHPPESAPLLEIRPANGVRGASEDLQSDRTLLRYHVIACNL